ncbi:MAG: lipid-binding SYLF domain-containing protein [Thermodesulfobacteriota bacterium]|nr:lipid-binding SYLF domain-containing protein [Thermodesulfobacteriota bacterium]
MSIKTRALLLTFLISIFLPHQVFAIGESLSGLASSAGDLAKSAGKAVGIGETAAEIDKDATIALDKLLKNSEAAAKLSQTAKAILVFPKILKAGLGVGGHHGNGALRKKGKTVAYYKTIAGSYGLQIGAQAFGYAIFFMDDEGFDYLLNQNEGWEVGVGPSVVLVDEGMAKTMNNTTITESVYVFTFNQHGLMAGLGIQGSKISKITP